jgi:uncharacterized protein
VTITSRLADLFVRLPSAVTRDVTLHRDLVVRTRDGIDLRTDHYAPELASAPTVLVRTPYGRRGPVGLFTGRIMAERGFHVVLQSCRGTFGSGGEFRPMRHERDDGLDTLAWIERQPWFNGKLFTYGPSYLGFTQWAMAADAGDRLSGMLTAVTASSFREPTYAGGSFSLNTVLNWATLVENQRGSLLAFVVKQIRSRPRLRRAFAHLPLNEVDLLGAGVEVEFFQEWLRNADDDPYWTDRGHPSRIEDVVAAVCMVGGWQDIFLPWQLADYARLRRAGRSPRLVIGPWTHASRELFDASMREGVSWFRAQLGGGRINGKPVRLYVDGAHEWREYDEYPPPGRTVEWFAGAGGVLAASNAGEASESAGAFRYDPADPTPSPGGPLLTPEAGPRDNRAVEARADVLVLTSEVLSAPFDVLGPVEATIRLRASSDYFDVHVRLCDVHPDGRSINICDGLRRVDPRDGAHTVAAPPGADGVRIVTVPMWPAGHRFAPGHRLRVQIAGAAHPRYARHTGTDEPLGAASQLCPIDYEVLCGTRTPTVITMWRPA